MLMVLIKRVEILVTHQVEGSDLVIVRLVGIDVKAHDKVEHCLLRLRSNKVEGIAETILTILTEHLLAIDLVVLIRPLVIILLSEVVAHHTIL